MNTKETKKHLEVLTYDKNWEPPEIIYGNNLIKEATNTDLNYLVVTMDIPWNLVKNNITKPPSQIIYVKNMHLASLIKIENEILDNIEMVIGIGGGSCHDCAKYIAIKKKIRLIQLPTMFGGDAVITTPTGIRNSKGTVEYIGCTYPDKIYIDFNLLRKAPPELIRYGAADILSSYTGLLDWKLAANRKNEKFDEDIADYAKINLLGKLQSKSKEIKQLTDEGIKTIIELYVEYHKIANKIKTDRPQEVSEHFFAYNAEYISKRSFVHGSLLSLGIWVIAGFYYNKREEIEDFLHSLGLNFNLKSAGLSENEFKLTLKTLNNFTIKGGYYYSIVNELEPTESLIDDLIKLSN